MFDMSEKKKKGGNRICREDCLWGRKNKEDSSSCRNLDDCPFLALISLRKKELLEQEMQTEESFKIFPIDKCDCGGEVHPCCKKLEMLLPKFLSNSDQVKKDMSESFRDSRWK